MVEEEFANSQRHSTTEEEFLSHQRSIRNGSNSLVTKIMDKKQVKSKQFTNENDLVDRSSDSDGAKDDSNHADDIDDSINNKLESNENTSKSDMDLSEENQKELNKSSSISNVNTNDTSLLSSSSTASSLSPNNQQKFSSFSSPFNQAKSLPSQFQSLDWYKQYELMNQRNNFLANGLQNYLKPNQQQQQNSPNAQSSSSSLSNSIQTTPSSSSSSSSSSSIAQDSILERLYPNLLQSNGAAPFANLLKFGQNESVDKLNAHQALLAQYAQQLYLNSPNGAGALGALPPPPPGAAAAHMASLLSNGLNHPNLAVMMAATQQNSANNIHSSSNPTTLQDDKERYLASLYNQQQQFLHLPNNPQHPLPHPGNFHPQLSSKDFNLSSLIQQRNEERTTNAYNNSSSNSNVKVRRRTHSTCTRSPSPASSEQTAGCGRNGDEEELDDEDCFDDGQSINGQSGNGEWTYEEQFKQLYELSDDVKRKEFLDDLFSFMQKRGSPVNRIPIMAKHVLDLYELYRLVVSKGGLVEVINKKLWREITKGLNLPSSITSAAFTLRTQYMKYLYPYECEKLKMSTPQELQAAIDGNRREGRRPVYGFEYPSPNGLNTPTGNMNSSSSTNLNQQQAAAAAAVAAMGLVKPRNELMNPNLAAAMHVSALQSHNPQPHHPPFLPHHPTAHNTPQAAFFAAAAAAAAAAQQQQTQNLPSHLYDPNNLAELAHHLHHQQQQQQTGSSSVLPSFLKSYFEINTPPTSASSSCSSSSANSNENQLTSQHQQQHQFNNENENTTSLNVNNQRVQAQKRPFDHLDNNLNEPTANSIRNKLNFDHLIKEPIAKKLHLDSQNIKNELNQSSSSSFTTVANGLLNSTNSLTNKMKIKILATKDSNSNLFEKSMSLSIELNGCVYQGTLYSSKEFNSNNSTPTPTSNTNSNGLLTEVAHV